MAEYPDLATWALEKLQATAAVTDLVVGGAASIAATGKLTARLLDTNQAARRDSADPDRVLAIIVWDRGEGRGRGGGRSVLCSVFLHDRGAAYANIQAVREVVISALIDHPVLFARDAQTVATKYVARTGHQRFDEFDLDFERIDFEGPLVAEFDSYL